jgi:hypothetical protein
MTTPDDVDDLSAFEAKETSRKLPIGWLLLFWGLIVWGLWYLWTYTPGLGGWSQAGDLEGAGPTTGTTIVATIVFTAIPTAAAIVLVLGQRRKKRR